MAEILDFPTRGMPGRGATQKQYDEVAEFMFHHRATRTADVVMFDGVGYRQAFVVDRFGAARFITMPDLEPYKR